MAFDHHIKMIISTLDLGESDTSKMHSRAKRFGHSAVAICKSVLVKAHSSSTHFAYSHLCDSVRLTVPYAKLC